MASGPWDNVQLPGPPNGPAYLSAFGNLLNSTNNAVSGLGTAYQQGQEFQQQQRLQNLFQNGVPTAPNGQPDFNAISNKLIQTGGADYAAKLMPFVMQQSATQTANSLDQSQQPQTNTGPGTSNAAAGPSNIHGDFGNQPRQTAGNDFGALNRIAAKSGTDLDAFLTAYPRFKPYLDMESLSPSQTSAATAAMLKFNSSGQGGASPDRGGDNPVAQAGTGNEITPSGTGGSSAQSPRQTVERRLSKDTARAPQAPQQSGGYQPPTEAEIENHEKLSDRRYNQSRVLGLNKEQAESYARQAKDQQEAANQKRKEREEWARATDPAIARAAAAKESLTEEQKGYAADLKQFALEGLEAKGHAAQIDEINKLGAKVPYGVIPKIQSKLGSYGIETKGLSDIQAYERAIDYMAPQLRPIGSGRLMQQELTAFKASLGGLMTTQEGRAISGENLKLISQYKEQIGKIAVDSRLSPEERMQRIYQLPPPHLKTLDEIKGQPAQQGQSSGNKRFQWSPDGGLRPM
jgi:hypothetical protein